MKSSKRSKAKSPTASRGLNAKKSGGTFERVTTGMPGLDVILGGGFLAGGTYLILGAPGAGKTILSNQLGFHESQKGGRAIYVTLLAENHARMFGHLDSLKFFDRSKISDSIQYVSGYETLEKDGLNGLLKLLGALVQRHKATVLFVDGVASAEELSGASINFKKFVHNLNAVLGISGCTTFLLSSAKGHVSRPEYTMVDGIISLTYENLGMWAARKIEVTKFRGSAHLHGRHFFEINDNGLVVYPRLDAAIPDTPPKTDARKLLSLGIDGIDRLVGGGVPFGSTTAMIGASGQGKTTIGARFLLEGAREGEKGLFLSLYEHPDYLLQKLARVATDIAPFIKSGRISLFRRLPNEYLLDKLVYEFLEQVRREKVKRVFIDGLGALRQNGMLGHDRLDAVVKAVVTELKHLGATTLFSEETDLANNMNSLLSLDSAVTDNVFEFRHVQLEGKRVTIVNGLKARSNRVDNGFYELLLEESGPKLGRAVEFVSPYLPLAVVRDQERSNTNTGKARIKKPK